MPLSRNRGSAGQQRLVLGQMISAMLEPGRLERGQVRRVLNVMMEDGYGLREVFGCVLTEPVTRVS